MDKTGLLYEQIGRLYISVLQLQDQSQRLQAALKQKEEELVKPAVEGESAK